MKKILFYLVVLAGCLALANLALRPGNGKGPGAGGGRRGPGGLAVPVEIASPTVRDLVAEGRFTGSLLPRAQYTVASKVAGRLKRLYVDIGDLVMNGTRVAELDDEEYVQAVAQAEADRAIARANIIESQALLDVARRELERVTAMRQQKVSSDAEVDSAKAQFDSRAARHEVNKASLAQKEAVLRAAQVRLGYTKLEVSWTGGSERRHIGARFQDEGALLAPNTPVVTVLDLATVTAVIDVVERDYFQVKIGQTAEIRVAAQPDRVFLGRVARLAPVLDPVTRQARVEIEIPNPDARLKPGMFVEVRLAFDAHAGVTVVPSSALVTRNGGRGLFQIDLTSRLAHYRPVEVGIVQGAWAEVASPTLDGPVVVMGHHLLEDGTTVSLPGDAPAPEAAARSGRPAGGQENRGRGKGSGDGGPGREERGKGPREGGPGGEGRGKGQPGLEGDRGSASPSEAPTAGPSGSIPPAGVPSDTSPGNGPGTTQAPTWTAPAGTPAPAPAPAPVPAPAPAPQAATEVTP
ncbi:MAG: efflux RND transporter periplasmic adaptor subunit [Candidatus Riflebacteria bacterium]|nr:efflux RND transporter periplasmic adaptor subunit [Candidatus Riflebacteria bacterium]